MYVICQNYQSKLINEQFVQFVRYFLLKTQQLVFICLKRETVWMVSLLSLWIDWAIVNCQPGSCELPLTVINGSILWLWETDQYVHE